jgi:hypothetical protein
MTESTQTIKILDTSKLDYRKKNGIECDEIEITDLIILYLHRLRFHFVD